MNPKRQKSPYQNPWPWWSQLVLILWRSSWIIFCSWTPKFFNPWRLLILKIFGAKISGTPFVHASVRVAIPWHIKLFHRACLGEKVNAYSLGKIEVHEGATISQEVYLCTGTHDFDSNNLQLITKPIIVESKVFIGVRTLVLPGVTIMKGAVIGAQSVVTKDIPSKEVHAGSPARKIRKR